ncbi:hypothetical protein ACFL6C_11165, partial [Myxococcota bacterium]
MSNVGAGKGIQTSSQVATGDRAKDLLKQVGVKKPLTVSDKKITTLTVNAGTGRVEVDTFAKVPKTGQYDGVLVELYQTKSGTAQVTSGAERQGTLAPQTMGKAYGEWVIQGKPVEINGTIYDHSELDRSKGDVVLSKFGEDE